MRILYYSVHGALEFDEIRLLTDLGHTVFSLGAYFGYRRDEPHLELDYRPPLAFDTSPDLLDLFNKTGCHRGSYEEGPQSTALSREFVGAFDAIIVMHSAHWIIAHWPLLRRRPVIWRSIGQQIIDFDRDLAELRGDGLKIVRYSPKEALVPGYIGHDTVIRFYKDPADFPSWRGSSGHVFTLTPVFAGRYPAEYAVYRQSVAGLPHRLGGGKNDGPEAIGYLSFAQLVEQLRECGAYFYCAGTWLPYTLNFIEAWMTGAPVVAFHDAQLSSYEGYNFCEIPELIDNGRDGFIVGNAEEAREVLADLLHDRERAARIGEAGRAKAIATFGKQHWQTEWEQLLAAL